MYLLLLGVIAVGAGLLLLYYSMKDKKGKATRSENFDPEEKGKVIYLFDEEDDGSGFSDPKKPESDDNDKKDIDNEKPEDDDDK